MGQNSQARPISHAVTFVNTAQELGREEAIRRLSASEEDARGWERWYREEVCVARVIHEGAEGAVEIAGDDAALGMAIDIDELPLVVADVGSVAFMGKAYSLPRDGLYRFMVMTSSVRNLIVARECALLPVLGGLAALQVHGNRENGKSLDDLEAALRTCSFLCITCGTIAGLAAQVLTGLGFETRPVSALTGEEWNTYDNGHALFEVLWPKAGKWVLADVDMGFLFRQGEAYLDAGEVWECLRRGDQPELTVLAPSVLDPFFFSASGFNWFLPFRSEWGTTAGKVRWYKRILQSVGIPHGGKRLWVGNSERILTYLGEDGVAILPYAQWRKQLYGDNRGHCD